MKVTIVDVEWLMKKSFLPNDKCMKISSYHKQSYDIVNFATETYHLKMDFDIMYVIKENILTDFPEEIDLLDEKVRLIGEGLKFYDRYIPDIDEVMAACRPDYLLYPIRQENKMANADIVQFFHEGKPLAKIQDYHNAYVKEHYTYITDKDFWEYPVEQLEPLYKKLRHDHHIVFKNQINFNTILNDKRKMEMFSSLKIDFNKIPLNLELNSQEDMDQFCIGMTKIPLYFRQRMRLKADIVYSGDHMKEDRTPFKDLYRYMMFIDKMKSLHLRIQLKAPSRMLSPFWFHFEDLEAWTTYAPEKSFVDFMTWPQRRRLDILNLCDYLEQPIKWSDDATQRLMRLWVNYPDLMEQVGYHEWGDSYFEHLDMMRFARSLRVRRKET